MTLRELFFDGITLLKDGGEHISNPKNDAELIFNFVFKTDNTKRIQHYSDVIDESDRKVKLFRSMINKRLSGQILQYILKSWSFMGYNFKVGEGVLCPREDTSALVRLALRSIKKEQNTIVELGAGSGIISILLAKSFPTANITAVEFSKVAYEYLKENVTCHKVSNVYPINEDMLIYHENYQDGSIDMVISNPPYITADEMRHLDYNVKQEPTIALFGGTDGLDFYRIIANQWSKKVSLTGCIALEIGYKQEKAVEKIFNDTGFKLVDYELDIMDRVRALKFQR